MRLRQAVGRPNDGKQLENRVATLFKRLGKYRVGTNLILVDQNGHRSEIDVYYGILFKRYIECKDYSDNVPLEMVAKFKAVLELNKIPLSHGIFVTTSDYTPRAREIGIRTINGKELVTLEKRARRRVIRMRTLKSLLVVFICAVVLARIYFPQELDSQIAIARPYYDDALLHARPFWEYLRRKTGV